MYVHGSGQFDGLDVWMPLAYERARYGVVAHVSGNYIANAPLYRSNWWKQVQKKSEIFIIPNLPIPRGRRGVRRCAWLIIKKHKRTRQACFKYTGPKGWL